MAFITGSVNLTGSIAPFDTNDVYPTHQSIFGKGGYREVPDLETMNSITPQRREEGMLVYVKNNRTIYQLLDGTWQVLKFDVSQIEGIEQFNNISYFDIVNEGSNTGYRLHGKNPENYGTIGEGAIDLSHSFDSTGINGATGAYSFAIGEGTQAKSAHSFVTGKYNKNKINTLVEVGMGTSNTNRLNAFEIYADGTILAPNLTEEKIKNSGPHSFVTKGYIDNLVIDCGLFG